MPEYVIRRVSSEEYECGSEPLDSYLTDLEAYPMFGVYKLNPCKEDRLVYHDWVADFDSYDEALDCIVKLRDVDEVNL